MNNEKSYTQQYIVMPTEALDNTIDIEFLKKVVVNEDETTTETQLTFREYLTGNRKPMYIGSYVYFWVPISDLDNTITIFKDEMKALGFTFGGMNRYENGEIGLFSEGQLREWLELNKPIVEEEYDG